MQVSVIIPTHNPDPGRLGRTLEALRQQFLPGPEWETILVNNASTRFPGDEFFARHAPANLRHVFEPQLGLTSARMSGFASAAADVAVMVDDDNALAPDYLSRALAILQADPQLGAIGGKSIPEFAVHPPDWAAEFFPLLALRDSGDEPMVARTLRPPGTKQNQYPFCAPIGAGMVLRRPAWAAWLKAREGGSTLSDRRGQELTSAGDNDIVFCLMHAGWSVGYFPDLMLTHLIPASRLEPEYLERLNRGIQKTWMKVLALHEACPWPPLSPAGCWLRQLRSWMRHQPWRSAAARIRWQGACGHFEGRVTRHP